MTEITLTKTTKWIIVLSLAALHPVLLFSFFPIAGEASNVVIFLAPLTASVLFNWKIGFVFIVLNSFITSRVFRLLSDTPTPEAYLQALLVAAVMFLLCLGASKLGSYFKERKKLAKELQQAQKLEAIGRLAGGVAHDMNNILNAIMGSVFALRHELNNPNPSFKDIDNIAAACDRGAELTRNLLGFARKNQFETQVFSLNKVVQSIESILKRTTNKNIQFELELNETAPLIEGPQSQFENAVMNLCLNGIDAIKNSGTLRIQTGISNTMASVTVSDTGSGMEEKTKARVFEPFFTTKPEGKGTGLGLALVYGVVRSMHGKIALETSYGKGTSITLRFPLSKAETVDLEVTDAPADKKEKLFHLKGKTALVVDDEPLVLRASVRMLQALGLKIHSCQSGAEGVELYKQKKDAIDLVILDVIMPHMDGITVLEHIQEINSKQPMLLVSGFSKDMEKLNQISGYHTTVDYLAKPFSSKQFLDKAKPLLEKITNSNTKNKSQTA